MSGMKRIGAMAVFLVLMMALPVSAALKMLPEAQAEELEGIAVEYVALEEGIDAEDLAVTEGWVRELRALGKDIYMVGLLHEDTKFMVAVDVDEQRVLTEEELEALIDEDDEKTSPNTAYTLGMPTVDLTESVAEEPANDLRTVSYWAGGAVILLGLSTAWLKVRRRY